MEFPYEPGDEIVTHPADHSRIISEILSRGGTFYIHGDKLVILTLPGKEAPTAPAPEPQTIEEVTEIPEVAEESVVPPEAEEPIEVITEAAKEAVEEAIEEAVEVAASTDQEATEHKPAPRRGRKPKAEESTEPTE